MFIKAAPVVAEEERRGSVSNWFSSLRRGGRRKREDSAVPTGYGSLGRRKDGTQSRGKTRSAWDLTTVTRLQLKDELGEVVAELEALDGQEECKQNSKAKQMSIGRKKFNMDPKKGIEYLYENGLLQRTPEDVAQFLHKGEGLSKTAIGDYLGERSDFNEAVLRAFVELHDFTDLILVQALRQFLWSFRLPGEAQKIDRMMESFAQRYCQLNPDIFTNADTCYVLSFAIIMLNTSLHNPSVKDKPTPEQFVAMNRGINNGGDLPQELLLSLYESIKTEPFKIPEDDGNDLMHTFFNPDKEGWLWKQGGRYKSWKRRWFILNDNCLYYFEYTTDKEPRGIIPLENISVRAASDRQRPHCLELYASGGADLIKACKTDSEGKVVEGKHTVYRMSAATAEERDEWIECLRRSISHNPFYDMLAQRKKKAQHNLHSGSH
ncbi:cytohesin-1 isoform X1 [Nymphalis io]|uniref:cytohesin-1 isoform X1 n=1 Tax=Vanessa cardui TaxID=171605 RepID=UPI001F12921A|nr:cytohesin-1 isoform X1 [Vanessa cardui]XP_046979109.1 cytohesin-1 isoform X1 [Vanessa cardui]XP_046979110.1 cytohesin-1 isoform X1 [Vanessa cardui]XP_047529234.1 cytohesin-1 isoform X1 [Vanessa atalanta]XP_050345992.1 cytohesin-1 isoform X1 [Nymphalis io]